MAQIVIEHLDKVFGTGDNAVKALDDVGFNVSGHVFVSIVGPSGCGSPPCSTSSPVSAPHLGEG